MTRPREFDEEKVLELAVEQLWDEDSKRRRSGISLRLWG